ncbi:MAG TPA: type II secretion system protein [Candidatus Saccharimonadales bacterium]|nr:type II secretion system protein [Candidatus Saccharimonadales bacterium]
MRIKKQTGFTIVELLIVIVVIGILAAITIVAYNGVQQRANNTARISAASQVIKLIESYKVVNNAYPATISACLTVDNICTSWNGTVSTTDNTALVNALGAVGRLPDDVPRQSGSLYGLMYNYRSNMTYNGNERHVLLMYWLEGGAQDCNAQNIVVQVPAYADNPDPWAPSTTGYTSTSGDRTTCYAAL